ncbi:MAG: leucine-rich repeat domain-containing protein, partial [Chlorobi bacterium]|nr:leucine-rich repeat domain-containing protein [Chlorobiota bacterium]
MFRRKLAFILLVVTIFGGQGIFAQETKQLTPEEIQDYTDQCKNMIKYLEGTFNFLGDSTQVPAEKEIIINNSYLKIFQSDETQIEDDLDPNRDISIMKDVQAYMKDIVFFFKNVSFDFQVNDVTPLVGENGAIVFKVTMNRNLKGITINNDTLDNNLTRYVEINLDPVQNDLKIASIYTTKPSQREEMRYWWEHMAESWKMFFSDSTTIVYDTLPFYKINAFTDSALLLNRWQPDLRIDTMLIFEGDTVYPSRVPDSLRQFSTIVIDTTIHYLLVTDTIPVNVDTIYQILERFKALKTLNISGNMSLVNLDPVRELTDLVEIDLSNTLINDLSPLTNLNKLNTINFSSSKVTSLEPLRYASNLKELNCSNTGIKDISTIEGLKNLNILDLSHTAVADIQPLANLNGLSRLDLSFTQVTDLSPLSGLPAFTDLNIAGTPVTDLGPLSDISTLHNLNIDNTTLTDVSPLDSLQNLHILQANNSKLNDITSLSGLLSLKYIYCDNSGIDEEKATRFMEENPQILVVYNTDKLVQWWEDLPAVFKDLIKERLKTGDSITTEELHR